MSHRSSLVPNIPEWKQRHVRSVPAPVLFCTCLEEPVTLARHTLQNSVRARSPKHLGTRNAASQQLPRICDITDPFSPILGQVTIIPERENEGRRLEVEHRTHSVGIRLMP